MRTICSDGQEQFFHSFLASDRNNPAMDIQRRRLKELVDETGRSENELSRNLLGWRDRRLNHYIHGTRVISVDVLNQICVAFKTHPNWMLGWSDDRTPPEKDRLAELERMVAELHKRVNRQ